MTAGAVSAPLIIPIIHLQAHRAKNHIDTNTPVSIQSDSPGVLIFYTVDGSRPAGVQRGSAGTSRKYSEPILLPAGRVCVRAVAVCRPGVFSLHTVLSSVFRAEDDGKRFSSIRSSFPEQSTGFSDHHSPVRFLPTFPGSGKQTNLHRLSQANTTLPSEDFYFDVFPVCQSSGVLKQLSSTHTSRIQRDTDFLRCAQCLSFRPTDPFARFCAQCGAVVPPLPEQRLPPAEGGQKVLCVFCNTVVPVNTHTCLICEASVQQQLQPQAGLTLQDHVVCVCCGSGNPAHITNCLTCESRLQPPGHAASSVTCWRCGASGHPYAFYCAACGVYLEASASTSHDAIWQATPSSDPTPTVKVTLPTADQYTQTVGLYYPSATELQKKDQQRALQLSRQQATRDRQPLLTAISPGRGYWRKQVDHVCAHLRSYAQNNAPFRTLLGEPRLGRMVSAVVQEDGHEVSLTISFVSAVTDSRFCLRWVLKVTVQVQQVPLLSDWMSWLQVKDSQLLKELGPGRGQISVIQQLLDQGADPSCCGSNGRHALAVAVVNGHRDVLPVLVQRGADVEQQSGHCRASVKRRNAAGQTAYDVAVSSGCNNMASLLAARTGLELLGKLRKPKLNLDAV
uniref:Double zinc ribbon and ankyrin repeat domains 1 n=1 Tax=Seriola lalandi dorsalis TaxID=1841481 RepID=A0A3B4XXN9_SERLL